MARNPSISLTEHQQEFVQTLVASGRYHGVSEVVRAGLRLLEDEEERRAAERHRLRAGVEAGLADIEAGRVTDFDPPASLRRGRPKHPTAPSKSNKQGRGRSGGDLGLHRRGFTGSGNGLHQSNCGTVRATLASS